MAKAAWILVLVLAAAGPPAKAAERLVSDHSPHRIKITPSYAGTELLLFGAIEGDAGGGDVVAVVKGPPQTVVVRRKERVAGIWVNADAVAFESVPSFYALASSRPLADIAGERELARHQLGTQHLSLTLAGSTDPAAAKPFAEALLRQRQVQGLYSRQPGRVEFLGRSLFRTSVEIPANVPVSEQYQTEVYLIRDGRVVAAQSAPLNVTKIGVEQAIHSLAVEQPLVYGLTAVALAAAIGWLSAWTFRHR